MQVTKKLMLCVVPASPQQHAKSETFRQISGADAQAFRFQRHVHVEDRMCKVEALASKAARN
jgi:hypothetical protein